MDKNLLLESLLIIPEIREAMSFSRAWLAKDIPYMKMATPAKRTTKGLF
jgi:hypothetical protein